MNVRQIRYFIFLKEIFVMSWTAFGGPQAHLALFLKVFVEKRNYLTEEALLEIFALCQMLPGPTSTQTITGLAYKVGGARLAYLTLVVWIFPAVLMMTLAALLVTYLQEKEMSFAFARFTQALGTGFILAATIQITQKIIKTKTSIVLMLVSAIAAYFYHPQWFLPLLIVLGGVVTTTKFKRYERVEDKNVKIRWRNLTYFIILFVVFGVLSELTRRYEFGLPFRLSENFFRTGSIIFGGGQVLIPLMLTEFVYIKKLISREEFDLGYNLNQILPGPTFSFAAFIGAMAMADFGWWGQVLGAFLATFGVFMPGTLLIFFVIQFWDELKKYRPIRASLEGINAVSVGLVLTAVVLMAEPIFSKPTTDMILDIVVVIICFIVLQFTKTPPPILVLLGLLAGFLVS
jgi:chromate transporter